MTVAKNGNYEQTFLFGNFLVIFEIFSFLSEWNIFFFFLKTKAQNIDCLGSTYKPGKWYFRLSEGSRF